LFLLISLQKEEKQGEGNLITFALRSSSDWAGPAESNLAHAGWARLNPKKRKWAESGL
jgi:hypothetical protein